MTQKEFFALELRPGDEIIVELVKGPEIETIYTGLKLLDGLNPDPDKQLKPLFREPDGSTIAVTLSNIANIEKLPITTRLLKRLRETITHNANGETVKVMDAAEDPVGKETGANEDLFATVIEYGGQKAVLLHWDITGDWTEALLIPENNFNINEQDGSCQAEEALEAFFNQKY